MVYKHVQCALSLWKTDALCCVYIVRARHSGAHLVSFGQSTHTMVYAERQTLAECIFTLVYFYERQRFCYYTQMGRKLVVGKKSSALKASQRYVEMQTSSVTTAF